MSRNNNASDNPFDVLAGLQFSQEDYIKDAKIKDELPEDLETMEHNPYDKIKLRIWLEKKKRKGKPVSIITGFEDNDIDLKAIAKTLKSKLGVGGSYDNEKIIIQGQDRDKIIDILKILGFKDIKKAGG